MGLMQPAWNGAEQVTPEHDPPEHDPPEHEPPDQDLPDHDPPEHDLPDQETSLIAVLLEIERHVGSDGWDQPARLFALVSTTRLMAAEPALADRLRRPSVTLASGPEDHLTAVEQEQFVPSVDLVDDLVRLSWPDSVDGCAVAVERTFLPAGVDVELPDDPIGAADVVAAHPDRQDVRVVVGVDRRGGRHGIARLRSNPDELLGGADLVPGLVEVLAHTLT
jgi:hypothetical protein